MTKKVDIRSLSKHLIVHAKSLKKIIECLEKEYDIKDHLLSKSIDEIIEHLNNLQIKTIK